MGGGNYLATSSSGLIRSATTGRPKNNSTELTVAAINVGGTSGITPRWTTRQLMFPQNVKENPPAAPVAAACAMVAKRATAKIFNLNMMMSVVFQLGGWYPERNLSSLLCLSSFSPRAREARSQTCSTFPGPEFESSPRASSHFALPLRCFPYPLSLRALVFKNT